MTQHRTRWTTSALLRDITHGMRPEELLVFFQGLAVGEAYSVRSVRDVALNRACLLVARGFHLEAVQLLISTGQKEAALDMLDEAWEVHWREDDPVSARLEQLWREAEELP